MKPERRRDGLVVKELPEEVLVYDLERHRAHCLNPAAAAVFKSCDGERTVGELARILRKETGAPADEAWVHLALDRLEKAHLLEEQLRAVRGPRRLAPRPPQEGGRGAGGGPAPRDLDRRPHPGGSGGHVRGVLQPASRTGRRAGTRSPLCTGICSCQSAICVGGCGTSC